MQKGNERIAAALPHCHDGDYFGLVKVRFLKVKIMSQGYLPFL
jgi:hypothetical protein